MQKRTLDEKAALARPELEVTVDINGVMHPVVGVRIEGDELILEVVYP